MKKCFEIRKDRFIGPHTGACQQSRQFPLIQEYPVLLNAFVKEDRQFLPVLHLGHDLVAPGAFALLLSGLCYVMKSRQEVLPGLAVG